MAGWSMAPWLKPGDVLWVDHQADPARIGVGEVVVMTHQKTGGALVHRVIRKTQDPRQLFQTKGDRNIDPDHFDENWRFVGKVVGCHRNGKKKPLRVGRLWAWLCVWNLYPGQRLPKWLKVLRFKKQQRTRT